MPIRTNRGRAAVYRKLWGWPMRSPKHLAMTAVIAAVLITGLGIVIPKLAGKNGLPASASTTSGRPGSATTYLGRPPQPGVTSAPTSLPTRLPSPTQQPSSAPAAPEALDTAIAWAEAWVFHPAGTTTERWIDRLRPHTTEEYLLGKLTTVEPANVPANAVTGRAEVKNSSVGAVEVEVPTDNGTLHITVIKTDKGWRVSEHKRVG
ncbi:hypothetical protein [Actinokineospora sp.]|uniref:hypothetical protein n=1 Tax=Actinokineospora sp. TaxID=1872133 RepID=UPI003D6B574A